MSKVIRESKRRWLSILQRAKIHILSMRLSTHRNPTLSLLRKLCPNTFRSLRSSNVNNV